MNPLEWVEALDDRLSARQSNIALWNDYYDGCHPLVFATEKFRMAFGGLFDEFSDNWCAPVVNAVDERLVIVGFRFGEDSAADKDAWSIWQANHMDPESKLGIKSALIDSRAFGLVWPKADGEPLMTIESADQMIVAYAPGSRYERVAALKVWTDEWTSETYATLYLPDDVYKYKKVERKSDRVVPAQGDKGWTWEPRRVDGEDWPLTNPLGVVPVVEIRNDPRMRREARSELESVIPLQDAVNKLVTDMVVASEFGAFKQKWATGIDIPVDPLTNQPIEEFKVAVQRFITAPPAEMGEEPARFGEFSETPLANFVGAIDMLVSHIASQSRTPPHYLSTSADRLSGESIKSAETGLVSKARDKQLHMGEGFEEMMRLAFMIKGDARADFVGAEVVWKDPETRSEAEHIDAIGKKRQMLEVPLEQCWLDADYSPTQVARFGSMRAKEALMAPVPVASGPSSPFAPPAGPKTTTVNRDANGAIVGLTQS